MEIRYLGCPECDADLHPSSPCEEGNHDEDCVCGGDGQVWYETGTAGALTCPECGLKSYVSIDSDGRAYVTEVEG